MVEERLTRGDYASADALLIDALHALNELEDRSDALRASISARRARAGQGLGMPLDLGQFLRGARAQSSPVAMKFPKISLKAVFVLTALAALPSACSYQLRDFRRTVGPFEQAVGRRIQGSGDGKGALLGRFGVHHLYLGHSSLDDAQLAALRPRLETLPNLSALDLSQTRITDAGLSELSGLAGLRTLILYNNALSAPAVAKLQSALPDCKVFYLDLSPAEVDAIKAIQRLGGTVTQVELAGSRIGVDVEFVQPQITDADLPAITSAIQTFANVRSIEVHGAAISPAGLAQLRQAFPQTQLHP